MNPCAHVCSPLAMWFCLVVALAALPTQALEYERRQSRSLISLQASSNATLPPARVDDDNIINGRRAGEAKSATTQLTSSSLQRRHKWKLQLVPNSTRYEIDAGSKAAAASSAGMQDPLLESFRTGDIRLAAYKFRPGSACGKPQNEEWCLKGGAADPKCAARVPVGAEVCESGLAVLATVYRDDGRRPQLVFDDCPLVAFAQYSCVEDAVQSVLTASITLVPWVPQAGSIWANRHYGRKKLRSAAEGVSKFFRSALGFEWGIFAGALPLFFVLHWASAQWPVDVRHRAGALMMWIVLALAYNSVVYSRLGYELGTMWLTGYCLELIFSIENVFVFHIVVSAFNTPQRQTFKGVSVVMYCQIVLQLIFYMGLAEPVRRLQFLPYVLGLWLIYVGVEAAKDSSHGQIDIEETSVFKAFKSCLGDRLVHKYHPNGLLIFSEEQRTYCSLLAPVVCCLLIVDFLLEIDVTLTKIEELPNHYISFTSSVVASFALPDLSVVSRALFLKFYYLKHGIAFVLLFFGVQMVGQDFLSIPDLISVLIMILVMALCIVVSQLIPPKDRPLEHGSLEDGAGKGFDAEEVDVDEPGVAVKRGDGHFLAKASASHGTRSL